MEAADADSQASQIETLINEEPDAIVVLPYDGAALTPVAEKAMEAGIPVINVDRLFATPEAARTTILGDNYGIGVKAAEFLAATPELRRERRRDPGHRRHLGHHGSLSRLRRHDRSSLR